MKNKKFNIGLALLLAGSLILTNCTKNKTSKAPEPDSDTIAAREAALMMVTVTDIGDVCGQVCNNDGFLLGFQSYAPLSIMVGTTNINSIAAVVTSTASKTYDVIYNNTVGKDGIVRNGKLHFDYSMTTQPTSLPATLYREAGYVVKVTSPGNLIINGDTVLINSMVISNTTPIGFPLTAPFSPSLGVNITWSQVADVTIHRKDGKTVKFNGTLNRTLLNTNNTSVPMPAGSTVNTFTVYPKPYNSQLYLQKEYVSYTGTASGYLSNNDAFSLNIAAEAPLTRNFNSSPEAFVAIGGVFNSPERHPFISGIFYVDPGTKTKRKVDFGSADIVDYNAKITIDGITYSEDFK